MSTTKGWTCQSNTPSEPVQVPGTVVTAKELPDKDSLEAAGIDVDQFFFNLTPAIVADDEERDAVRGVI